MCGIFAIFGSTAAQPELRRRAIAASRKLRHRGPDWTGTIVLEGGHAICHERLGIVDPESGAQPLISPDGRIVLAVNGEIYNYRELYTQIAPDYVPVTGSDCEVVIPLFQSVISADGRHLSSCPRDHVRLLVERIFRACETARGGRAMVAL